MKHIKSFNENANNAKIMDIILDKISAEGIESLTDAEKKIMGMVSSGEDVSNDHLLIDQFAEGQTYTAKNGDRIKINTIDDTHVSYVINGRMQDFNTHDTFLKYMNGADHDLTNF